MTNDKNLLSILKKAPKYWILNWIVTLTILGLLVLIISGSNINWNAFNSFINSLPHIWQGITNPNFAFLFGFEPYKFMQSVVYFSLETLAIAFVGTIIGAILAVPIGVLSSKNITGKTASKISDGLLILIRTFPEVVLAILLFSLTGQGPFLGVLVIGIHSVGMLGKLFAEAIENLDEGPLEALESVGATTFQKLGHAVLPNVFPDFLSIFLYRFDINIRNSFILGFVFAGGLGSPISSVTRFGTDWPGLTAILIAVIVMVLAVEFTSTYLRKKLL